MGFSEKQLKVLTFPHTDYDALICDGSVRSGKTASIQLGFILDAMNRFNNQAFGICAKSITSGIRNIIRPILSIQYLHEHFDIKFTNNILTVKRGNKTNLFYLFGGMDESSYKVIQGVTLAGVFFDEVALMPRSFVEQALARCSVEGSKFWFSCNPDSPDHWFYNEWILKADDKNAQYLHFTMDDNPSLSQKIKDRYHRMYEGVFHDRYIKGLWVRAEGIIYRNFADNNERYILDEVPSDIIMLNAGVDFGGNKSAHTFVLTGFTRNMKEMIVLEAERITKEITPNELDELFVDFCRRAEEKYKRPFNARCDNAEPVLIRGLKNAVLRAKLRTQVKLALKRPIKDRIEALTKIMGLDRFKVMRHCSSVINALNTAVWDEKHEGERLDDGTSDIDTLDALEYSFEEFINKMIDVI